MLTLGEDDVKGEGWLTGCCIVSREKKTGRSELIGCCVSACVKGEKDGYHSVNERGLLTG